MSELKAFFLVGPTASGKTAVSQWIAENYSCEILSADSMMVYRGMDIGTAKPEAALLDRVRYFGLDLVSPRERFSVGMYRKYALNVLREINAAGRKVIIAGGTGLYTKSLTHGLSPFPAGNVALRMRAEAVLKEGGITRLQDWVKNQVPENYEALADKENPRRLIRALEIAGDVSRGHKTIWRPVGKGPKLAGLFMPIAQLHERIQQRVRAMYSGGLIDEAKRLLREGVFAEDEPVRGGETSPTAAKAIGYAEAMEFLRGKLALDEAIEITALRTRRLAKRQMTWFRHQADVEWIPVMEGMKADQIGRMVMACWEKFGPTEIAE